MRIRSLAGSESTGMLWKYYGQVRPPFAEEALPGQESVWDYPRPPRLERDSRHVRVCLGDLEVADTHSAVRVLETASAPGVYIPRDHVRMDLLRRADQRTFCEWKGEAEYFDLLSPGGVVQTVGWSYRDLRPGFAEIAGHISFYPRHVECFIDAERVVPQAGGFYGGWVTSDIAGPVKGGAGTGGW